MHRWMEDLPSTMKLKKALIEAQLNCVKAFTSDSPRKQHVLAELNKDHEHLKGQMAVTDDTIVRRKKMTEMHTEFFELLNWQRAQLNTM